MSDDETRARQLWSALVDYARELPDHGASSTWGPDQIAAAIRAAREAGARERDAAWAREVSGCFRSMVECRAEGDAEIGEERATFAIECVRSYLEVLGVQMFTPFDLAAKEPRP